MECDRAPLFESLGRFLPLRPGALNDAHGESHNQCDGYERHERSLL